MDFLFKKLNFEFLKNKFFEKMDEENEEIEWYISEENLTVFSGRGFNEESQRFMKEEICEKCFTPKEWRQGKKKCPICKPTKRYQERRIERMIELEKEFKWERCRECNRTKLVHKESKNCAKCYGDKRKYKKRVKENNLKYG